jgi:hypothetical protein
MEELHKTPFRMGGRRGQAEPFSLGHQNLLKPALKLMSVYRFKIKKLAGDEPVTNFTRWIGYVQVRGKNKEVYVTFDSLFRKLWFRAQKSFAAAIDKQITMDQSDPAPPNLRKKPWLRESF